MTMMTTTMNLIKFVFLFIKERNIEEISQAEGEESSHIV